MKLASALGSSGLLSFRSQGRIGGGVALSLDTLMRLGHCRSTLARSGRDDSVNLLGPATGTSTANLQMENRDPQPVKPFKQAIPDRVMAHFGTLESVPGSRMACVGLLFRSDIHERSHTDSICFRCNRNAPLLSASILSRNQKHQPCAITPNDADKTHRNS